MRTTAGRSLFSVAEVYRTIKAGRVILLVIILTGCGAPALDKSLLTDEICAAPCWCNITPGVTTDAQAVSALSECPWVKRGSLHKTPTSLGSGEPIVMVGWDHRKSLFASEFSRNNRNDARVLKGKIDLVTIFMDYPLTLEQVVSKFGPPEGVYAVWGATKPSFMVILDYPHRGLSFEVFLPQADHHKYLTAGGRGVIYPDMKVTAWSILRHPR